MHIPDPDPKFLIRFHFLMMCVWLTFVAPTVMYWKDSILWVAFMSLYANFVGHFSGWDAARAEANNKVLNELSKLRREVKSLRTEVQRQGGG